MYKEEIQKIIAILKTHTTSTNHVLTDQYGFSIPIKDYNIEQAIAALEHLDLSKPLDLEEGQKSLQLDTTKPSPSVATLELINKEGKPVTNDNDPIEVTPEKKTKIRLKIPQKDLITRRGAIKVGKPLLGITEEGIQGRIFESSIEKEINKDAEIYTKNAKK